MLYNKNSVRKTNDKKILHKVGKQWKVISVALLMAIGGGAAVAATNTANANADANNGLSADDQAQISSLEQGPTEGQSSAPASQSSKASSASDKAPVAPNFSNLRPDSYYNGNNASAEKSWVLHGYDKAVVKYYGNKVNSYVSNVNSKLPSLASSYASAYDEAASTQNTDKSLAASYSATGAQKGWSAEVSNIARNKSGIDAQDYIANVSASAQTFSGAVTAASKNVSGASSVASLAALIFNINTDPTVSGEYNRKYTSAYMSAGVVENQLNTANKLVAGYQANLQVANTNYSAAINNLNSNEYANSIANADSIANSNVMSNMASDMAKNSKIPMDLASDNVRGEISSAAHDFNNGNNYADISDPVVREMLNARVNAFSAYSSANASANSSEAVYNQSLKANSAIVSKFNEFSDAAHNNASSEASFISYMSSSVAKNTSVSDVINSLNIQSANARLDYSNATSTLNNTLYGSNADFYRLLSDVAEQQVYGSNETSFKNAKANASNAISSLTNELNNENSTVNSLNDDKASASSALTMYSVLGNNPKLNEMNSLVSAGTEFVTTVSNYLNSASANDLNEFGHTNNSSAESDAVSDINSVANNAGSNYNKAVSASASYASSADTDFVLAQVYADYYGGKSSADAKAFASASANKDNFYKAHAGSDFGNDEYMVNTYTPAIEHDGAFANAYATYVRIREPHVVTIIKKAVLHSNPDYNVKSDQKLDVVPVGTHLKVENVGFDREGDTRLYVNYNGKHGFITGLRTYVKNSYLSYGVHYKVTYKTNVNIYKSLQFNKGTYVKTLKAGTPVEGTAVRNDPGYYNGLTRLQLDTKAGTTPLFTTTLDTTINNASELTANNGQAPAPSGAFFYNGQDTTPAAK